MEQVEVQLSSEINKPQHMETARFPLRAIPDEIIKLFQALHTASFMLVCSCFN
jgi:hypothetical protein